MRQPAHKNPHPPPPFLAIADPVGVGCARKILDSFFHGGGSFLWGAGSAPCRSGSPEKGSREGFLLQGALRSRGIGK